MQIVPKRIFPTLMLCLALSLSAWAQSTPKTVKTPPLARPKLVVGIVVDQMRYDYLYRYYDKYKEGGFKRLLNDGFNCRNNHYHYALTVTGAGHSAIYTGSMPAINGIVGNDWYDQQAGRGVYCAEDTAVTVVGSTNASAGKRSPRNLLVSTVTDQLQIATNFRSKSVGIAIKDRGAILPAGHTATGAYWFDSRSGNWVTSTYYANELPQWVQDYNAKKMPTEYIKGGWNTLLPIEQYTESTPDDQPYEQLMAGKTKAVFPYELGGTAGNPFGIIASTPWGNTMTKDMAIAAIKGENMGKGKETDFLAVSFSTPDGIGHAFGPNSVEEQDIYLRLDLEFADFFNFLDSWVGKGQYTIFLSADHGVMDVPGFWKQHNLPAGVMEGNAISLAVKKALQEAFGSEDLIRASENYQLYLDHAALKKKKISVQSVYEVVREALLPMPGVADIINLREIGTSHLNSYLLELYKNGTHVKRSGDIQIVTEPGWFAGRTTGTTHGSPYNYDTHVPFLLYGWGINKGETLRRTTIADIAPTISSLLRILPPSGNVGNAVEEALKK
ncbi:alkaline phosphatase family protein [Rhabdobacter roseus]|uniref:Putative AlkP superfamily pyrophosphatase or phosphodiesterase n=1 Tax=Rhabdobacter roseus TaxID=1655419 RepID=A0A840U169_9BACT|nr:alkaline phosphatase PafA [Rhabdobacter roseus]MBB5287642.1 putative AlkP superfamily pyrophosphatase or phosphodiesterase [Rhabdobacter roseus]